MTGQGAQNFGTTLTVLLESDAVQSGKRFINVLEKPVVILRNPENVSIRFLRFVGKFISHHVVTQWRSWLRHCATNRKVSNSNNSMLSIYISFSSTAPVFIDDMTQ